MLNLSSLYALLQRHKSREERREREREKDSGAKNRNILESTFANFVVCVNLTIWNSG